MATFVSNTGQSTTSDVSPAVSTTVVVTAASLSSLAASASLSVEDHLLRLLLLAAVWPVCC
jgi:hypothetical protein